MVEKEPNTPICYWFDKYALEPESRTLFRERAVIKTPEKTIQLLQVLLQKPGQVASRDELLDALWPEQDVSEWSLSRLVSDTRQLLGESARDQGLIQTVRGRGFRLNPEVDVRIDEPPNLVIRDLRRHKRQHWIFAAAAVLVVAVIATGWLALRHDAALHIAGDQRIVVLPVTVATGDDQDSWVAYGVMTVLTGQLQRFPELRVADVESSLRGLVQIGYDAGNETGDLFARVCEPLGCERLIATHLALNSDGVPELSYSIHSGSRRSPEYRFANEDILQASNTLFEHLIQRLLPPQPERVVVDGMYTENAKANQNFALGVSNILHGDYDSAERYLEMALEQKPDYFWAQAYMSDALTRQGEYARAELLIDELSVTAEDVRSSLFLAKVRSNLNYEKGDLERSIAEGEIMLQLARQLGDKHAEGLAMMNNGATWQALGNYEKAETSLLQALAVFHGNGYRLREAQSLFNLGNVEYSLGNNEEALNYYSSAADEFRKQGALQYLSFVRFQLAGVKTTLGRLDLAEIELREVDKLYRQLGDEEGVLLVQSELGHIELMRGNLVQAEQLLLTAFEHAGDTYTYVRSWTSGLLALCYLNMGDENQARAFIDEREAYDWFDARVPMVFIEAGYSHLIGDYSTAVTQALEAKARVGDEWSDEHEAWLAAFQAARDLQQPMITDYYTLNGD